ncbi:MAG: TetR/AcrR family transcriptional regulator [Chitinophagales bacterium]
MPKEARDTRATILKIALQLFLQRGYKDVSYQDIIKKTGLSKGAIYHYFKSKEDLLAHVFEFLLEATRQPGIEDPENLVTDYESFQKLFIGTKKEQFKNFKKLLGTKSLKFNKILFFLEAIIENERLKKIIGEIMKQEIKFLEKCFSGLKKHKTLPGGKDPALLAESLFWMLQGTETLMLFSQNSDLEEDFIKMYKKTIEDFFKII